MARHTFAFILTSLVLSSHPVAAEPIRDLPVAFGQWEQVPPARAEEASITPAPSQFGQWEQVPPAPSAKEALTDGCPSWSGQWEKVPAGAARSRSPACSLAGWLWEGFFEWLGL